MARTNRPVPPPLEGNDMLITAVITLAWAVAFIVLLVAHSSLPTWSTRWIWTCAVGVGLGLFGLAYVPRIKRSRARAAARRRAEQAAGSKADVGPE
ncbi:MAG: DUF2530 domain-containing protein [Streptosporangiaceae bacterium]